MSINTLPASIDHLMKGLVATHARVKTAAGDENYLKLAKTGVWTYGADEIDVEEGSEWAIDPNSFVTGFIAWEPDDNKPAEKLGEEMRPATDPPILRSDLPDVGAPWAEQMGCQLMCLTGEDKGTRVSYATTSKGGLRAINTILGEVVGQLQAGEGDSIVPVVDLAVDSYNHKRYGRIFTPVFKLNAWESLSNTPAAAGKAIEQEKKEPEPEPEPAPVTGKNRRTRRAPVAAKEPEPAPEAAPVVSSRRRRRSA